MSGENPLVYNGTGGGLTFTAPPPPSITIGSWVTIHPNGEIEYGKDYTPDKAARAFWDAIGLERKQRLP